ncbi:MAG: insulinase family protein [Bryobacterales bacterium]|nr:insulinase family protein [Bryobacterales bacterium]
MPAIWLSIAAASLLAQTPQLAPVKFSDTRLPNGLRVLISEDHSAPVFSIAVSYNAGSRDERAGRTGFAHLFEHMMFKGSENVGQGEHPFLVFNNGGNMNGTTNADRTLYFETLPKNQLDLALFLEADRMRSLAITKENLDNQRSAVQEERRLRVDNAPYGKSFLAVSELAYDNFAYKHSVIGSMEDLNAATVDDVREFFRIYYAPNNAAVAIVGDVQPGEVLAKVKKYFGGIPSQPAPKAVDLAEPEQTSERRMVIEDKQARLPQVQVAYKIGRGAEKETAALEMLSRILGGGESSRLYQRLVKEKETAVQAASFIQTKVGPGLFQIVAFPRAGKPAEETVGEIGEEIARLHSATVTAEELRRARAMTRRIAVSSRESSLSLAVQLADNAVLFNDPGRINSEYQKLMSVTEQDIQNAVKKYLRSSNRSVIVTMPAGGAAPARKK